MARKDIYTPPLCVWKVIEESASPEKHSIIRSLVGISKLEYAVDLRNEVYKKANWLTGLWQKADQAGFVIDALVRLLETLVEIWNELNSEAIPARYRPQTHLGLPEPPKQREMLVTEIHLLLENLKDKDNGGLGFIPNDCSEDVINYTNHIIDQRTPSPTTPLLRGTPNSILNDGEIVDAAKNIPVLDNESPIQVLQNVLRCECDLLADDIEYIRRCVEEGRCDFEEMPEPTLLDLKNERKKLENHLIKSIEINPTINASSSISINKAIPLIRPSTPVPRRKNLPPIRHTSAMQNSTTNKEATRQFEKTQTLKTVQSEISLLGCRSHTDPSGSSIKISKELRRRKSASAIPVKTSSDYETLDDRDSPFEHGTISNRKHCGIFCGTPDSGVSSRPVSELGIIDPTLAESTMSETVANFSELRLEKEQVFTKNPQSTIFSPSCTNSTYKYMIKNPQPPIRPRPPTHGKRSIRSAKFHKIKASGSDGL